VIDDSTARAFDVERHTWDRWMTLHRITSLPRFSDDGRRIVIVDEEGALILDATNGKQVARFPNSQGSIDAALTTDGRFLATATNEVAHIWDVKTGEERVRLTDMASGGTDHLSRVMFSHDGKYLATAHSSDVRLWLWRREELLDRACRDVRSNLTQVEWSEYVGKGDVCEATCSHFPACAAPPLLHP
jgi:WD40 repeat protein